MTKAACIPAVLLLALLHTHASAQDSTSHTDPSAFSTFLSGFETDRLPFDVHPPMGEVDVFPQITDAEHITHFLQPHGVSHNTNVRAGQLLYRSTHFVALSVLVTLGEERAWYLLTFSPQGSAIDKARIGAYNTNAGGRHEHWSRLSGTLAIEHTALYRFTDADGTESACTQSAWTWHVLANGTIDRSAKEEQTDCTP